MIAALSTVGARLPVVFTAFGAYRYYVFVAAHYPVGASATGMIVPALEGVMALITLYCYATEPVYKATKTS